MDEDQQFCLRWNNHQSTLISVFDTLLEKETLVDCTLAAEGQFLKAHKVVLSACSPYFAALLSQQYDKHPIFILKDVKFQELRAMMDYMYRGEVNISQDQLAALLKAAESLQIKGLSDSSGGRSGNNGTQSAHAKDTSAANKNASSKGSGLTIEQKMPRLAAQTSEMDADLSEAAHEGSASPNARKRKKVRRRSIETNNVDNHDHHSNSSSHSMPHGGAAAATQQQQPPPSQAPSSTMPTTLTSATSSANVLSVTKKTDQEMKSDGGDENDDQHRPAKEVPQRQNNGGRKSISSAAMPTAKTTTTTGSVTHKDGQDLIEPKNEYDESNEETVEDLTLDEEEMMEEMDQAGPSHGGEGSSQGYPQWPVDRSQDNEAFMSGQDAAGHHRDAQVKDKAKPSRPVPAERWSAAAPAAAISSTTEKLPSKVPVISGTASGQVNNGGVAKKTTKNHPRIKYSVKQPPGAAGQPTSHSMAAMVSSIASSPLVIHNHNQKSELLNFTLSRKFGHKVLAVPETEPKTKLTTIKAVYPAPTTVVTKVIDDVTHQFVIQEQSPETKLAVAQITNEELQTSIMSELSNYEIDEIELNPYQGTASAESIDREGSQSGTMYRMSGGSEDIKYEDSSDIKYASSFQADETDDGTKNFECRHCGKKYRWKSTLRRHENVECGGKEPAHQCPHCSYKAKQRGNLGVHIRKHHSMLPQLESRRKNRPSL